MARATWNQANCDDCRPIVNWGRESKEYTYRDAESKAIAPVTVVKSPGIFQGVGLSMRLSSALTADVIIMGISVLSTALESVCSFGATVVKGEVPKTVPV